MIKVIERNVKLFKNKKLSEEGKDFLIECFIEFYFQEEE